MVLYSDFSLIHHSLFSKYVGLVILADQVDIHLYMYIILVLGNCGGLEDEVLAD